MPVVDTRAVFAEDEVSGLSDEVFMLGGKDDVAAYAEGGVGVGDGDGIGKSWAGGHEGGGGEDSGGVEFADGAVDAGSEAEVVGVEDEAGGHC